MVGFAWGVDCAADGFAIGVVTLTGEYRRSEDAREIGRAAGPELRCAEIHEAAQGLMWALAADLPPRIVVVEQPVGRWPNPRLNAAWGAITAAASGLVGEAVVWMAPPEWRKRSATKACDEHGAELLTALQAERGRVLPKAHPLRSVEKQRALARARVAGYEGWSVDVADAVCMALAGLTRLGAVR